MNPEFVQANSQSHPTSCSRQRASCPHKTFDSQLQAGHELAARLEGVAQDLLETALVTPRAVPLSSLRVTRCCALVSQMLGHGLRDGHAGWIPYIQATKPSAIDVIQVGVTIPSSLL